MRLIRPLSLVFFFNDTATTEIYTLSLHDALPIFSTERPFCGAERAGPQRKTARKTGMKRIQTMLFPDRRRRCMKSPRTRVYRRDRPVRNDGFRDSTGSKTHNTAPRRSVEIGRAHV